MRNRLVALAASIALAPSAAVAYERSLSSASVLSRWDLSPDIVVPTALVILVYAFGVWRRPGELDAKPWRNLAFIWGVIATFLSLASPLDALADHLFFMHQVQHMLLRVVGPMLITVGQPQAVLTAGLPAPVRRAALAPILSWRPLRGLFAFLTRPAVVTFLFVASLYVWQWPRLHNLAILDEGVHYLMHVTMLAAGLLFFWRIFDHRPPPKGAAFGARLMMLWIGVLSNIPIGAFTSLKTALSRQTRILGQRALSDARAR